jgi:hypothetical protein
VVAFATNTTLRDTKLFTHLVKISDFDSLFDEAAPY